MYETKMNIRGTCAMEEDEQWHEGVGDNDP